MAREPRNYGALRTDHSLAPEQGAPNQSSQQQAQEQTTRQAADRSRSPGWTEYGDMASQQASAIAYNDWVNRSHAARDHEIVQTDRHAQQDRIQQIDPDLQRAQELAAAVEARRRNDELEPNAPSLEGKQNTASRDQEIEALPTTQNPNSREQTDAKLQRAQELADAVEARNQQRQQERNIEQSLDRD
jgi:hypothetical protein